MSVRTKLPKGWTTSRIGDVVEDRIEQGLPENSAEFIYVDISAVDNQLKQITTPKRIPTAKAPSRARQKIRHGDVLVSTTRPNLNAVALVPRNLDHAIASTGFTVLRPIYLNSRWLYSVVQSEHFIKEMSALVKGALYPAVRPNDVRDYVMPLPPLSEQGRITRRLEQLLNHVRNVHDTLESLPPMIQEYREAIREAASTGRLIPTEAELTSKHRSNIEPASKLLERILHERRATWEARQLAKIRKSGRDPRNDKWKNRYAAPVQPVSQPNFRIPDSATWVSLDQLLDRIEAGKSFKCLSRPANKNEWGVIKVSAMSWGKFDAAENKALPPGKAFDSSKEIKCGDILLSRSNTSELVGACVLVGKTRSKLLLSDKSMRLLPSALVDRVWLQLVISSRSVRSQLSASATGASGSMLNISQQKLLQVSFALPPLADQRRIVAEVSRRLSALDRFEKQVIAALKESSQFRAALFQRALSGKLVNQSAQDEPAGELLRRVAVAKQSHATEQQRKQSRRMKKPKSKKGELLPNELLAIADKHFGKRQFTFEQLAEHVSVDYEPLKIGLFRLLASKKGGRMRQLFNQTNKRMELRKAIS